MTNPGRLFVAALSWACLIESVHADSSVQAIWYNGTPEQCAQDIWVSPPGGRAETRPLCVNNPIAAGTTLEMPQGVTMRIGSAHAPDNHVIMQPFSRAKLVDTANGSTQTSFFGEIVYNVTQRLSYYFVKDPNGKTQAAMEGTVLRTTVRDDRIAFDRLEGRIRIEQPVRMQVQGVSLNDDPRRRDRDLVTYRYEVLDDGNQQFDYGLDYYDTEFIPFNTVDEAIDYFDPRVEFLQPRADRGDPASAEELADIYVTVGQLLAENGEPEDALALYLDAMDLYVMVRGGDDYDPMLAEGYTEMGWARIDLGDYQGALEDFEAALDIRETLDPWDIWVADSLLDLAALYFHAGNLDAAFGYTQEAIAELDLLAYVYADAYEFAREERDIEYAYIMAENLIDNYELTAHAYDLVDDVEGYNRFMAAAAEIRQTLGIE